MMSPLAKFAGRAALAAGVIQLAGIFFLVLFFALEMPQGSGSGYRFGFWSDVLPILAAVAAMVMVAGFYFLERKTGPVSSIIALIAGLAGNLVVGITNILFVSEWIGLEDQVRMFFLSMAFLGAWQILASLLGRRSGLMSARLGNAGMGVGAAQLITFTVFYLLDGYKRMSAAGFESIAADSPLLIMLIAGIPATLIGFLGEPLWLLWLGNNLTHNQDVQNPVRQPAAM